jgi:tRNA A-37 threonylcarbamoyl transferase component Bud32
MSWGYRSLLIAVSGGNYSPVAPRSSFRAMTGAFKRCVKHLKIAKTLRFVFHLNTSDGQYAVKVYRFDKLRVHLRSIYGRCQARKEWENHLYAHRANIETVPAVALGERRLCFGVREAIVVTKWEPDATNLIEFRKNLGDAGHEICIQIAQSLGRLVARTQRAGIYHNEIKPGNLLIKESRNGLGVLLIDWKHARLRRVSTANDLQNLLRIKSLFELELLSQCFTTSEWQAFLMAYFQASADRTDRQQLAYELRDAWPNISCVINGVNDAASE